METFYSSVGDDLRPATGTIGRVDSRWYQLNPSFHMPGKSQTIGDSTFCQPSQNLPIYRWIIARCVPQILPIINFGWKFKQHLHQLGCTWADAASFSTHLCSCTRQQKVFHYQENRSQLNQERSCLVSENISEIYIVSSTQLSCADLTETTSLSVYQDRSGPKRNLNNGKLFCDIQKRHINHVFASLATDSKQLSLKRRHVYFWPLALD